MAGREILVSLDYLDPDGLGGAARVALEEARVLERRGHRVTILAGAPRAGADGIGAGIERIAYRYDVIGRRGPRSLARALVGPAAGFRLRYRRRPDLVIFHQPLSALVVAAQPELAGARRLYHYHSPWPLEWEARRPGAGGDRPAAPRAIRRAVERIALRRAHGVLVSSRFMASRLADLHRYLPASRVHLVPLGVDVRAFRPLPDRAGLRRRLGLPGAGEIVLTVRRLTRRMGLENLVDAVALLARERPGLRAVIVGEGELREELEARARALGIADRVRLWGYASAEDLVALYGAADLFVLPTAALEGFGLVTLEALACGLPVLGTPVGATREILGRLSEDLVFEDAGSPALARRIGRFFREGWARRFPGEALRRFVLQQYSWEAVADALEALGRRGSGAASYSLRMT